MNKLLKDQIDYYEHRAPEYDEWFYRLGRYDRGEEQKKRWFKEVERLKQVLAGIGRVSSVLEIACGTGIWTKQLVDQCDSLIALDAAEAMININKRQNEAAPDKIRYVPADFYEWTTPEKFNLLFTSFFISHVPKNRLSVVAEKFHSLCEDDGQVLIFDSLPDQTSSATDHHFRTDGIQERKLNNGKAYNIIKIFYQKDEVLEAFKGFKEVQYGVTGNYFWYALCKK